MITLLTLKLNIVHVKLNYIFKLRTLPWKKILNNNTSVNNIHNNETIPFNWYSITIKYGIYYIIGTSFQIVVTIFWKYIHMKSINSSLVCMITILPLLVKMLYMANDHSILIRDIYFVKWEEVRILSTLITGLIFYIIFNIFGEMYNQYHLEYIGIILKCLCLLSICVIKTHGLIYKMHDTLYNSFDIGVAAEDNTQKLKDLLYVKSSNHISNIGMGYINNSSNILYEPSKIFRMILNDNDGVQLFIEHEFQEYTIENILSFIEFIQFLKLNDDNIPTKYEYNFCDEIPTSGINANNFGWFRKITQLYNKYIKEFCELQINIPYNIRMDFERNIDLYMFKLENFQETQPKLSKTPNEPMSSSIDMRISPKKSYSFEIDTLSFTGTFEAKPSFVELGNIKQMSSYAASDPQKIEIPSTINEDNIPVSKVNNINVIAEPVKMRKIISAPVNHETTIKPREIPSKAKIKLSNSTNASNYIEFKFKPNITVPKVDLKKDQSVSLLETKEHHETTFDDPNIDEPISNIPLNKLSVQTSFSFKDRIRNNVVSFKQKLNKLKSKTNKPSPKRMSYINKMDEAKKIDKQTFMDIIYRTLSILLKLNGQSIARFIKTQVFTNKYIFTYVLLCFFYILIYHYIIGIQKMVPDKPSKVGSSLIPFIYSFLILCL